MPAVSMAFRLGEKTRLLASQRTRMNAEPDRRANSGEYAVELYIDLISLLPDCPIAISGTAGIA